MRVISQDGKMDIPYEECIFQVWKNDIWCLNNAITGNEDGWKIAIYSTEEKALKAMEMCRDSYAENELVGILCKGAGFIHEFKEDKIDKYVKMYNFQFPQDEDIV